MGALFACIAVAAAGSGNGFYRFPIVLTAPTLHCLRLFICNRIEREMLNGKRNLFRIRIVSSGNLGDRSVIGNIPNHNTVRIFSVLKCVRQCDGNSRVKVADGLIVCRNAEIVNRNIFQTRLLVIGQIGRLIFQQLGFGCIVHDVRFYRDFGCSFFHLGNDFLRELNGSIFYADFQCLLRTDIFHAVCRQGCGNNRRSIEFRKLISAGGAFLICPAGLGTGMCLAVAMRQKRKRFVLGFTAGTNVMNITLACAGSIGTALYRKVVRL